MIHYSIHFSGWYTLTFSYPCNICVVLRVQILSKLFFHLLPQACLWSSRNKAKGAIQKRGGTEPLSWWHCSGWLISEWPITNAMYHTFGKTLRETWSCKVGRCLQVDGFLVTSQSYVLSMICGYDEWLLWSWLACGETDSTILLSCGLCLSHHKFAVDKLDLDLTQCHGVLNQWILELVFKLVSKTSQEPPQPRTRIKTINWSVTKFYLKVNRSCMFCSCSLCLYIIIIQFGFLNF